MKKTTLALATLLACAASAQAQTSNVTVYGRVDLSLGQAADAAKNNEVRPGSGNRLGFRGVEALDGGLKAVFHFEHRFNADDGTANSTFWAGRSVVGLEGGFGRVLLGREENPAYVLGQVAADPWGTDTVAANDTIIKGRIGQQRYANSIFYTGTFGAFTVGAHLGEADGNTPTGSTPSDRAMSLGVAYKAGNLHLGAGYENPPDADDDWATLLASYKLGDFKLGAFVGSGTSNANVKRGAYLLSATAQLGGGEARLSLGQLKNKTGANPVLDKQIGLGYHYPLSKRTTVYADVVREKRDNMAANLKKTGFDLGIKHNF